MHLDSGNDAVENLGILMETRYYFIIKRSLCRERKEEWLVMAEICCKDITTPRAGKTVYIGSGWKSVTYKTRAGEEKDILQRNICAYNYTGSE